MMADELDDCMGIGMGSSSISNVSMAKMEACDDDLESRLASLKSLDRCEEKNSKDTSGNNSLEKELGMEVTSKEIISSKDLAPKKITPVKS